MYKMKFLDKKELTELVRVALWSNESFVKVYFLNKAGTVEPITDHEGLIEDIAGQIAESLLKSPENLIIPKDRSVVRLENSSAQIQIPLGTGILGFLKNVDLKYSKG